MSVITLTLDLAVVAALAVIAWRWNDGERPARRSASKTALKRLRKNFISCGLCGAAFVAIEVPWPGRWPADICLAWLVFLIWRYAAHSAGLKALYDDLVRVEHLEMQLAESGAAGERLNEQAAETSAELNALIAGLRAKLAQAGPEPVSAARGLGCQERRAADRDALAA
jgi:hypothetical protein